MNARYTRKQEGQSVALIAIVLAFLLGMVALAVDVGATYAEQRNVTRGTNAAAISAMNRLLDGGLDGDVSMTIFETLRANGVAVTAPGALPQAGERQFEAFYLDASGRQIADCGVVGSCAESRPSGVKYIKISLKGEVDTYFARLFGTNTLPVGATAFSSRGICTSGYYPIAVRSWSGVPLLGTSGWENPDGLYTDETYPEDLGYKRLYWRDSITSLGAFSLLRWTTSMPAGNGGALAAMLAGDGTIDEGYQEVTPWPSIDGGPLMPDVYPFEPGQISRTDWVFGNYFGSSPFTSEVVNQLAVLKANRTLLTLPVYRNDNGNDLSPAYYVERFGAFLLVDYGTDSDGAAPDGPWIELAYVKEGGECAGLVGSDLPIGNKFTLGGPVGFVPRYAETPDADRPVQFVVVLDVTGSMSWNFAGEGAYQGGIANCRDGSVTCDPRNSAHPDVNQRRIYVAKEVLYDFVERLDALKATRPNDVVQLVTFTGASGRLMNDDGSMNPGYSESQALDITTKVVTTGWTNDKATLDAAINAAGMVDGDPYLTRGSTPSALGIRRAAEVLSAAPTTFNGMRYRRVVIFVTDGVANVLMNGVLNNYNGCAAEVISCQAGSATDDPPSHKIPGTNLLKPVNALIDEATKLKDAYITSSEGSVYVVALGSLDQTGLDSVATQAENVKIAEEAVDLAGIFEDIQAGATRGVCVPIEEPQRFTMLSSEIPRSAWDYLMSHPTAAGKITATDSSGNVYEAPVQVGDGGRLTYEFSSPTLPAGTYTLSAQLAYMGPDGIARTNYQLIVRGPFKDLTVPVVIQSGGNLGGYINFPLNLDLNGSACPS